jgi:hypothetical protein
LSLLGPNILLCTLSLRSSVNVSDQVSHPYNTKGRIIVLKKLYERITSESCMLNTGNWRLQKIAFLATP